MATAPALDEFSSSTISPQVPRQQPPPSGIKPVLRRPARTALGGRTTSVSSDVTHIVSNTTSRRGNGTGTAAAIGEAGKGQSSRLGTHNAHKNSGDLNGQRRYLHHSENEEKKVESTRGNNNHSIGGMSSTVARTVNVNGTIVNTDATGAVNVASVSESLKKKESNAGGGGGSRLVHGMLTSLELDSRSSSAQSEEENHRGNLRGQRQRQRHRRRQGHGEGNVGPTRSFSDDASDPVVMGYADSGRDDNDKGNAHGGGSQDHDNALSSPHRPQIDAPSFSPPQSQSPPKAKTTTQQPNWNFVLGGGGTSNRHILLNNNDDVSVSGTSIAGTSLAGVSLAEDSLVYSIISDHTNNTPSVVSSSRSSNALGERGGGVSPPPPSSLRKTMMNANPNMSTMTIVEGQNDDDSLLMPPPLPRVVTPSPQNSSSSYSRHRPDDDADGISVPRGRGRGRGTARKDYTAAGEGGRTRSSSSTRGFGGSRSGGSRSHSSSSASSSSATTVVTATGGLGTGKTKGKVGKDRPSSGDPRIERLRKASIDRARDRYREREREHDFLIRGGASSSPPKVGVRKKSGVPTVRGDDYYDGKKTEGEGDLCSKQMWYSQWWMCGFADALNPGGFTSPKK